MIYFLKSFETKKKVLHLHHFKRQTHGVIGNTPDFGSVIRGSSPCGSTLNAWIFQAFFFIILKYDISSRFRITSFRELSLQRC